MITDPILLLIALVGAHLFFDYAGQGDFMSKAKNPTAPFPGVPWWNIMAAHSAIHGAAVALITGIWWLFVVEAALHFMIDTAKCRGRISYNIDQAWHLLCKLAWWCVVMVAA
jgi:hypothetical protein